MSFADDLRRFREKSIREVTRVKRAVGIKLFSAIIMDTPVFTGRLRANWQISVNEPDPNVSYSLEDKTGAMMIRILGEEAKKVQYDDTFIMQNSLPYAYRIEYEGWSHTKSPEGMVRRNTTRFARLLSEAVRAGRFTQDFDTSTQ